MRAVSTRVVVAVLGVALTLGPATAAAADGGSGGGDQGIASTTVVVPPTLPRAGGVTIRQRWRDYQRSLAAIDKLFIESVASAEAAYHRDLRRATSTSDQLIARAVLRQSLTQASDNREMELERLGEPPARRSRADHADHARGPRQRSASRSFGVTRRATAAVR